MQVQLVLHPATGFFAGDDVAQVRHGEDVFMHGSRFCLGEALDAVGGEDEIEIEGAVLELDEVLASDDFRLGVVVENEAQFQEGFDHALAVLDGFGGEDIHVLRGAWVAEKDGGTLADEEVINACRVEGLRHFLRLKWIEWQAVVHSTVSWLEAKVGGEVLVRTIRGKPGCWRRCECLGVSRTGRLTRQKPYFIRVAMGRAI
jgi:hypothetical protein